MERDLLPWILGGALITSGAIAAVIEFWSFTRLSPPHRARLDCVSPDPRRRKVSSLRPPPPRLERCPRPLRFPRSPRRPAPRAGATMAGAAADASRDLPAGEVWQCIVNGQKVFSDKRCGNGASVRQIGDLNVMDMPASQPMPYGAYPSGYAGAPYPSAPYPDDQDDTGNAAGDVYAGQAFIVARERARREHWSRQDNHVRTPPSRGGSGSRNSH